jgi:hypothetical protein
MEPTVQSTGPAANDSNSSGNGIRVERAWLIEELRGLFPECPMWTSPAATEADLRCLIDLYRPRRESLSTFQPTGLHTQIGGNRVYLTRNGIAVRPPAYAARS